MGQPPQKKSLVLGTLVQYIYNEWLAIRKGPSQKNVDKCVMMGNIVNLKKINNIVWR